MAATTEAGVPHEWVLEMDEAEGSCQSQSQVQHHDQKHAVLSKFPFSGLN